MSRLIRKAELFMKCDGVGYVEGEDKGGWRVAGGGRKVNMQVDRLAILREEKK